MAGQIEFAAAALDELRRAQPNISLAWIANQLPWKLDSDREHTWRLSAGPAWTNCRSARRRAAARRPTRSSIDALLPRSCFRSLLETVVDLTAADTDVIQLPVTEQAQRGVLRLTFVPRNCRNSQAIGEAA
jgi:hypothetical protein